MNALKGILPEGLEALAHWALHTGVVVSVLIVFVLLVRRPIARYFGAHAAYTLWALPLVRVFMPPMTLPFLRRINKDQPALTPQEGGVTESVVTSNKSAEALSVIPPSITDYDRGLSSALTEPVLNIMMVLGVIWLVIAVLWFGFQLTKQARFARSILRNSQPASDALLPVIEIARQTVGLRKLPIIKFNPDIAGPMVSGVLKPFIILPMDFETRFDTDQQHFALVHEMAHIKRKDLWAALASLAVRALFWPNPLVHYAAHKLRSDQEAACDASVVALTGGDAVTHSYAETLIHAAKGAPYQRQAAPLGLALFQRDTKNKSLKETKFNKETNT